jgi:hypothetical protein
MNSEHGLSTPFLDVASKRVHRFWWTCVPALPTARGTQTDEALRRVWFDHTMNTFKTDAVGSISANSRGFYTEGTEDHVVPALFQTWAIFPDVSSWMPGFLTLFGIPANGTVRRVRWCYLFEQIFEGRRFCIADIVLAWEDDAGKAVVVLEAKTRGGGLTEKDLSGLDRYLQMPSIKAVPRRYLGFLVDASDVRKVRSLIRSDIQIVTWQAIVDLQIEAAHALSAVKSLSATIATLIATHASYQGFVDSPISNLPELLPARGTSNAYARIRDLGTPPEIEAFLLGSEAALASRTGVLPEPPFEWLRSDPDALQIWRRAKAESSGRQTVADRRVPRWQLDWQMSA